MLRRMAESIHGDGDPTQVYYVGQVQQVAKNDHGYTLTVPLPFVAKEDVQLTRSTFDELVIHIGNHKRNLLLPRVLLGLEVVGAKHEGDELAIRFEEIR
jgi:arsenite-transporting ATPase